MNRLLLPFMQSKPRAVCLNRWCGAGQCSPWSGIRPGQEVDRTGRPPPRSGVSRPCAPYGRIGEPSRGGRTRAPTGHPCLASRRSTIGHADRPDQVERKTTEYPSLKRGVKAGPGWPRPGCRQSAAGPCHWQEGTPARRSPPPARRCPLWSDTALRRGTTGRRRTSRVPGGVGLSSCLVEHDAELVHSVRVTVEGCRTNRGSR
jgi:hypothetical protein